MQIINLKKKSLNMCASACFKAIISIRYFCHDVGSKRNGFISDTLICILDNE